YWKSLTESIMSSFINSLRFSLKILAFSACFFNLFKLVSNSFTTLETLFKLTVVRSSWLVASSFCLVYKPIPAASSKILLLSSGLASTNH
ncbi:MAG: hypothetical protein K2M43_01565, partial [Mycoplasmoidaceae bacterium]|nr:hypothetical protein [Mycoplasmoidaceae bacterium]